MKGYKNEITEVERLQSMLAMLLTVIGKTSLPVRLQMLGAVEEVGITDEEAHKRFADLLDNLTSEDNDEEITMTAYGIIVETVSGFQVRAEDYQRPKGV